MKKNILFICAALALASCGKNNVGDFSAIVFNGSGKAYISQGSKNEISKKSGAMYTSVDKNVLYINGSGDIYIEVKSLDSLIANGDVTVEGKTSLSLGTATVTANGNSNVTLDVTASSLTANANGEKNFTLTGTATDLKVNENGNGKFSGFGLKSSNCTVMLMGYHDCEVYVTNTLNVTLIGSGNVYYMGNPATVNPNITGTGQLFKK
jgi:hypothetical protein